MKWLMALSITFFLNSSAWAVEPPFVEKYLLSGDLSNGELVLEAALVDAPDNDQVRFGLGVIRLVRGVERLGQSLTFYGVKTTRVPVLRLPVPRNPNPAVITYTAFRRMLDDFYNDLESVEETLSAITDDNVQLPLHLNKIHLDLDGNGKANEEFGVILKSVVRQDFEFLKENPDFEVHFDRGDVAWLRAYCHLVMSMVDMMLVMDTEESFNITAHDWFEKPEHKYEGTRQEQWKKLREVNNAIYVKEPLRFNRFRLHLIAVTELNHETWKHIRLEEDDQLEWLPNPSQKGVLGLPVREEMIDAWLAMMDEFKRLLEGKKTFPRIFDMQKNGKGLNFKIMLTDPPEKIDYDSSPDEWPDKYFTDDPDVDLQLLFRVFGMFSNPAAVGYSIWFN